jgi:hypothetical protein
MTDEQRKQEFFGLWDYLNTDEQTIVLKMMERLVRGREVYDALNLAVDTRDWEKEEEEELLDALVYRRIREIQAARGG